MKTQIRRGIFETNSSSEHSLTIMPHDKFLDWQTGKCLARVKCENEADNCWGNFWSRMKVLEFTYDFEQAMKDHEGTVRKYVNSNRKQQEEWKEKCLTRKKLLDRKLTSEELEKLSDAEYSEYEDKLYEDECYEFDEENYNYWKNRLDNTTVDNYVKEVGITDKFWFTYEEFMNDLKEDCLSPFEHFTVEDNIHIIGKYFHS